MMVLVLLVMVVMVQITFPFCRRHVTVGIVLRYTEYAVYAVPVVEVTTRAAAADGGLLRGRSVGDHRNGTLLLLLLLVVLLARWARATVAVAVLLVVLQVLLLVVHVFRLLCRLVPDDPAKYDAHG